VVGNNKCSAAAPCCPHGFTATQGWDPATGLGSINYGKMQSKFVTLGDVNSMTDPPTATPTFAPTSDPTSVPTAPPSSRKVPTRPTWKPTNRPVNRPSRRPTSQKLNGASDPADSSDQDVTVKILVTQVSLVKHCDIPSSSFFLVIHKACTLKEYHYFYISTLPHLTTYHMNGKVRWFYFSYYSFLSSLYYTVLYCMTFLHITLHNIT
jgi:hypothetical protein